MILSDKTSIWWNEWSVVDSGRHTGSGVNLALRGRASNNSGYVIQQRKNESDSHKSQTIIALSLQKSNLVIDG